MTRRNRFDPDNEDHIKVRDNPKAFTRASRRAVGLRGGVHVEAMRAFYAENTILPRAIRRLMRDPQKAQARLKADKAKVNRLLAPYGASVS